MPEGSGCSPSWRDNDDAARSAKGWAVPAAGQLVPFPRFEKRVFQQTSIRRGPIHRLQDPRSPNDRCVCKTTEMIGKAGAGTLLHCDPASDFVSKDLSETTRYSYFFPFNVNFILSLSSTKLVYLFTGNSFLEASLACRTWYSTVEVWITYSQQSRSSVFLWPFFCDPQSTDFSETTVPSMAEAAVLLALAEHTASASTMTGGAKRVSFTSFLTFFLYWEMGF